MTLFKNLTAALLVTAVAAPVMAASEAGDALWGSGKEARKASANTSGLRAAARGDKAAAVVDYTDEGVQRSLGFSKNAGNMVVRLDGTAFTNFLTSKRKAENKGQKVPAGISKILNETYGPIIDFYGQDLGAVVTALNEHPLEFVMEDVPNIASLVSASADLAEGLREQIEALTTPEPTAHPELVKWAAKYPGARLGHWDASLNDGKGAFTDGTLKAASELEMAGLSDMTGYARLGKKGNPKRLTTVEDFEAAKAEKVRRGLEEGRVSHYHALKHAGVFTNPADHLAPEVVERLVASKVDRAALQQQTLTTVFKAVEEAFGEKIASLDALIAYIQGANDAAAKLRRDIKALKGPSAAPRSSGSTPVPAPASSSGKGKTGTAASLRGFGGFGGSGSSFPAADDAASFAGIGSLGVDLDAPGEHGQMRADGKTWNAYANNGSGAWQ